MRLSKDNSNLHRKNDDRDSYTKKELKFYLHLWEFDGEDLVRKTKSISTLIMDNV